MKKLSLLASAILLASQPSQAAEVNIPHAFQAGNAAVAKDVNENFNALATGVNDNHQRINDNGQLIDNNTQRIATLENQNQNQGLVLSDFYHSYTYKEYAVSCYGPDENFCNNAWKREIHRFANNNPNEIKFSMERIKSDANGSNAYTSDYRVVTLNKDSDTMSMAHLSRYQLQDRNVDPASRGVLSNQQADPNNVQILLSSGYELYYDNSIKTPLPLLKNGMSTEQTILNESTIDFFRVYYNYTTDPYNPIERIERSGTAFAAIMLKLLEQGVEVSLSNGKTYSNCVRVLEERFSASIGTLKRVNWHCAGQGLVKQIHDIDNGGTAYIMELTTAY